MNLKYNLDALMKKNPDLFTLRALSQNATELGRKREFGLLPRISKWWKTVPHPPTLNDIARELYAEFDLQWPEMDGANFHGQKSVDITPQGGHEEATHPCHNSTSTNRAASVQTTHITPLDELGRHENQSCSKETFGATSRKLINADQDHLSSSTQGTSALSGMYSKKLLPLG
jgi:hypothetical protein